MQTVGDNNGRRGALRPLWRLTGRVVSQDRVGRSVSSQAKQSNLINPVREHHSPKDISMNAPKKKTKQKKPPKPVVKTRISQSALANDTTSKVKQIGFDLHLAVTMTPIERRRLQGALTVSPQFIEAIAAAFDQHGVLIGTTFDADAARESIAFEAAFTPVVAEIRALAQRLEHAIIERRATAGEEALAAYAAMKGAARSQAGLPLREVFDHVSSIMKHRRAGRRHRAAPGGTPVPTPAPAPQPPAQTAPKPQLATVLVMPQEKGSDEQKVS